MHLIRQLIATNAKGARHFVRCYVSTSSARTNTAAVTTATSPGLSIPIPEGVDAPPSPKLLNIVNDIAKLNLLEVSELSALLKKTLNLPDAPVVSYAAGGPVAPAAEEEEVAVAAVQTQFTIKLVSFNEAQKVALIKECKNLLEGMNLVQAKKFVESCPAIIKEDISKDDAEALKVAFEKVGAVCEIK